MENWKDRNRFANMIQQLTRSVKLTPDEKKKLEEYDDKHGYKKGCEISGIKKATWFNILNTGVGRSDNIDKIKAII